MNKDLAECSIFNNIVANVSRRVRSGISHLRYLFTLFTSKWGVYELLMFFSSLVSCPSGVKRMKGQGNQGKVGPLWRCKVFSLYKESRTGRLCIRRSVCDAMISVIILAFTCFHFLSLLFYNFYHNYWSGCLANDMNWSSRL